MVKSFLSAVFYFVGHGFEANGQCYLLPIGAPGEGYGPESLPFDGLGPLDVQGLQSRVESDLVGHLPTILAVRFYHRHG